MASQQQQQQQQPHKLQTSWTFWFDKKPDPHAAAGTSNNDSAAAAATSPKLEPENYQNYAEHLTKLGSFDTVEGFWNIYSHLARPSTLPKLSTYHLMRHDVKPMWESYPNGGCWIIKMRKKNDILDRLWEQLLFALIGEEFEEPDVVGCVLSIRNTEDVLAIWNGDNQKHPNVRFRIGEKIKDQVLHLGPNTLIEYKHHSTSIRDKSSYRHTKTYVVTSSLSNNSGGEEEKQQQQQQQQQQQEKKSKCKNKSKQSTKNKTTDNTNGDAAAAPAAATVASTSAAAADSDVSATTNQFE